MTLDTQVKLGAPSSSPGDSMGAVRKGWDTPSLLFPSLSFLSLFRFCPSASQGWVLCALSPLTSPLSFSFVLPACWVLPCLFSAFVVFPPVFLLLFVAGCSCSLLPSLPPLVCVCVKTPQFPKELRFDSPYLSSR